MWMFRYVFAKYFVQAIFNKAIFNGNKQTPFYPSCDWDADTQAWANEVL